MELEEARALLDGRIARMNEGDVDGMLEGVHPEVVWQAPPGPSGSPVFRGHEGVRQFVREWLEAWGKFEQEVLDAQIEGDWAVARVALRTRGEASGLEMEFEGGYLMGLKDGLLVYMRIYTDYDAAEAAWRARAFSS